MIHCITAFCITQKMEMERMLKTLHHFHPNLTEEIFREVQPNPIPFLDLAYYDYIVSDKYTHITHIDADVLIVDKIDELFDENYDAIAGRNNSDDITTNFPVRVTVDNIDPILYVNAGIHTISSTFCKEWYGLCLIGMDKYICKDQDLFNILFYSSRYKTKLLDPIDSNVYWGTSFLDSKITFRDGWKNIIVVGDHLELNNKRIKMMHFAGGGIKPPLETLVTKEVYDFIMNIIGE
jgi:hypothetical protein